MRTSGILMPIFSLPTKYGIGTFGKEAYEFVDFLNKAGQSYWQILPLNPTNYGDSPYQSFSSAAGNPYFIDLDMLSEDGLLNREEYENVDFGDNEQQVDYAKLYYNRIPLLKKAYERFKQNPDEQFYQFCAEHDYWLSEYALFMAVKDANGGKSWREWDKDIQIRNESTLLYLKQIYNEEIEFHKFVQYKFYCQWHSLKDYANKQGIKIIGDMPIYVADDSADVWSDTKQFDLDENLLPNVVAGCPPDAFSQDGQLWGMPVYNWNYMSEGEKPFEWWKKRIGHALKVYDVIRIDHFRGFESFYCIKYGAENAKQGVWRKGPGMELFNELKREFGENLPIIAEDLGFLTDEVRILLKESGFPGMKVLQFAFNSNEDSHYLPHNYSENCIVYTGTHDNDTITGWCEQASEKEIDTALKYMNLKSTEDVNWGLIKLAMMSVAEIAIFMMPDLLGVDKIGRINTPSTVGENWKWRMQRGAASDELAQKIYADTALYGRTKK